MASVSFVTLFDQFSIGIRIMANVLRHAGHESRIIYFKVPREYEKDSPHPNPVGYETIRDGRMFGFVRDHEPWTDQEASLLISRLKDEDPDMIGFSTRSIFDHLCSPLLERIRQCFPDALLVAGGYGPTLNPKSYLNHADLVVFGEGEEVILGLAEARDAGRDPRSLSNLVYLDGNRIVRTPVAAPEGDLLRYPGPYDRALPICFIDDNELIESDPAAPGFEAEHPVMAGRGCVGNCRYCSAGQWKKLYRERGCRMPSRRLYTVDRIIEELKAVKERGYSKVYFLDSFLTGPRAFLMDLFHRYEQEVGLPFSANFLPAQIVKHTEILDAACRAGFARGTLGIQHGSEAFRAKYFGRSISNDLLLRVARLYHERGILTEYHLIAGIPFETEESLSESLDFVASLPRDHAFLVVFRLNIFPCSPLEQLIEKRGLPRHVDRHRWYLTGLLYYLRSILDDGLFDKVRTISSELDKDNLQELFPWTPGFSKPLFEALKQAGITAFGPPGLMEGVYREYLKEMCGRSVVVWGTGGGFEKMRHLFSDVHIEAFIDNDRHAVDSLKDGIRVRGADYLKDLDLPVFICSYYKKDIHRQIRSTYPHISIIP